MQTNTNLDRTSLGELIVHIFESGKPQVYIGGVEGARESKLESARLVNEYIDEAIKARRKIAGFAIWYPEAGGYIDKAIGPDVTKGKTPPYSVRGWGIILLQLDFENLPLVNCCISCSTRKKADTWFRSHRERRSPALWDWKAVERCCGRIIRVAEELEKRMAQSGTLQQLL